MVCRPEDVGFPAVGSGMSKKTITINEIARLAGVSKKSVSRVLNDEQGVSDKTRAHIKHIMQEAGYEPDRRARALASSRSLLLGLAYNNRNPSYILDLLAGSQRAANALGYEVVMHQIADEGAAADDVIRFMRRSGCDGLIITPPLSESARLLADLVSEDWPMVRVAGDHADFAVPQIRYNDRTAALSLTNQLLKDGHRELAFIGGPAAAGPTKRRLAGIQDALTLHGLTADDLTIVYGDFTFESGKQQGLALLQGSTRPSAIVCANDEMAAGVYHAAAVCGVAIPAELSVTGFDDSPVASHLYPPLTSVRQPVQAMMALAVQMLTGDSKRPPSDRIAQFDAEVVARESTAVPHPINAD